MTEKSLVQRRHTLTVPRKIREAVGLREGTEVIWELEGSRIILIPKSYRSFRARFKGKTRYERRGDKEEVEKEFLLSTRK